MPLTHSEITPSRLRLRALRLLMAEPARYNVATLADALAEKYQRVHMAVRDIEAEFGLTRESKAQLITVILPGAAVVP